GWGVRGFTTAVRAADVDNGGVCRDRMGSPDGKDYRGTWVDLEIVPGKRIVNTDSFAGEEGNVVPATYYGMNPEIPLEMLVTITFEDEDGGTKVTLRHAGMPAGPERDGATQGWNEMFDKLVTRLQR